MRIVRSVIVGCVMGMLSSLWGALEVPGALTYEKQVQRKHTYQESIPIRNTGDEVLHVKVSHVDYLYNAQGENKFDPLGTNARSNAPWITLNQTALAIAPQTTMRLHVTVNVPDDPALEGTYWSVVLIEPIIGPGLVPDEESSVALQTVVRYGVQLITQVGEGGAHTLSILNKALSETQELTLDVSNEGTLSIEPSLSMDLFDAHGVLVGHFTQNKHRILPLCSVRYGIDLSSVTPGVYKAVVIFDGGEKGVVGAQYDLKI